MLQQRLITALVLLAILLPTLFQPDPRWFAALSLLFIGAAAWEWGRLNSLSAFKAVLCGVGLVILLSALWSVFGLAWQIPVFWRSLAVVWVLISTRLLWLGVPGWPAIAFAWRLWGGLFLIGSAWLALVQALAQGIEMLLSVMALVWMADSAAYFGGRAFGKRKLAPSISPGKSWAGVYSGALGVLLLAVLWIWVGVQQAHPESSLYGRLWLLGPVPAVAGLLLLTAMSVCGDLVESLVKRSAGIKDSSQLLPGHGGVLDRIDALLPVLPLAMMLLTF